MQEETNTSPTTEKKVWQRAVAEINAPGVPSSFRRLKQRQNIARILRNREIHGGRPRMMSPGDTSEEQHWAEHESVTKHESRYFELPPTTKSTISIAISPDGRTFASTHGDHTVKIICYQTGRILQTLVGHPRTPWSVKFHPTNPRYVASGCLGFQVRFWDIETGRCLYVSTLRHAIISISFHPSGDILAIASGTCVYTWDYQHSCPRIAMFSYQTLRSVTFLPDPTKIMVGEANERYVRPQGQNSPSDLTVTLTLWDFDPSWALSAEPLLIKKAMHNSRVVLSHALIYNDGGFDVSKCGRYLAICADFSLQQAEKEMEQEAANETDQAMAPAPQEANGEEPSSNDDVNELPNLVPGTSSSAVARALRVPTASTEPRRAPITSDTTSSSAPGNRDTNAENPSTGRANGMASLHVLPVANALAALQSAANELSVTMDQYMNQQVRRVRPRLHPNITLHRHQSLGAARTSPLAPGAITQRYTQIRPNIALSRTRFTRNQRNQRGRLASEVQSTWLALISLDSDQLGKVIQTCHLPETAAGGVTSVKISPSCAYVLLGYGVRDRIQRETSFPIHRVTRIYRWEDMKLLSHVESELDDVNIALFSPICGAGFLYGTKQGKLRVCNTYRGDYEDDENCNVLDATRRCHFDQSGSADEEDDEEDEDEEDDEDEEEMGSEPRQSDPGDDGMQSSA
ncbi:TPA: hypothetical protein N0F65_007229 [Lagenidium giganteum]|uniref:Activating molecule in BECN1-regulated autophagy protein 1 n=1 Tax=Lagenidium giganteum TaxID=4803 RepID=A0AAV2Z999_9STRA|nr:TPA: hypothetical protein N0F65_007229 [Lagenidium giganteum]